VVVLSRADLISAGAREAIRETVRRNAPNAVWAEVVHTPTNLVSSSGERSITEVLRGERFAAFCGIGNPTGFRRTLESLGGELAGFREYPDHHGYSTTDFDELAKWVQTMPEVKSVLCTLKDLVKIERDRIGDVPLRAVVIGMTVQQGQTELEGQLEAILAKCKGR
jgi:tetraacyldisaccharide 4'-kinase